MKERLHLAAVTIAALEGLHQGGDGEGQQEEPDHYGDLRRLLKHVDEVPPPEMNHVEVSIEGQRDEEADTRPPVEEQHEEHCLTNHTVGAAPLALLIVVGLGRKTHHQQEVSDHNIEEEDAFVLPEFEPKEEVRDKQLMFCSFVVFVFTCLV